MKLTSNQKDLLQTLAILYYKEGASVCTSQYTRQGNGVEKYPKEWKIATHTTSATVRSLLKRGLVTGETYWQGATLSITDAGRAAIKGS